MELKFDPAKISIVPIEDVRPNSWNPKHRDTAEFQKVKQSIQTEGMRGIVVVRENNGYEIIDGEQRWRACSELGLSHIPIYNEGTMDDAHAKALTIWYQQQVPFNEIMLASVVTEILAENPQITMPYTEEELKRFAEMANFDWDQYQKENGMGEAPTEVEEILTFTVSAKDKEIIEEAIAKAKKESNDLNYNSAIVYICGMFL